jgi:hypothetical protein
MAVRFLFNTEGAYVAFVQGENVFSPEAEWLGFLRSGNELYAPDGHFIGYVLDDDRVARRKGERKSRMLAPISKPFKPFKPFKPLKRLRMPKLLPPYEDVFEGGVTGATLDMLGVGEVGLDGVDGSRLEAADGVFLGNINRNSYDVLSLASEFGQHGTKYGQLSILNPYSTYGSRYSQLSPFNEYSRTPPRIVRAGRLLAFLTTNAYVTPRVDPNRLLEWVKKGGRAAR